MSHRLPQPAPLAHGSLVGGAGRGLVVGVDDPAVVSPDLVMVLLGGVAQEVPELVNHTALARLAQRELLQRQGEALVAIGDRQLGTLEPSIGQVAGEGLPGRGALATHDAQAHQDLLPGRAHPDGGL